MSDTVTDILAFAAKHSDYWEEILAGEKDYGNVLSADEVKAFEAARAHISESVYDLLKVCGEELTKRAAADGKTFPMPRFQREKTQQNRRVQVLKQETNPGKLYGAFFSLEGDGQGTVQLYASVSVYKEIIETLKQSLHNAGVKFEEYDGYYLYAPGISLEEKKPFSELAASAADNLWTLLKHVK